MNAFYEQHGHSIRAGYRCFDRILLNGLIQPFQQPERVVGFFNFYRKLFPVTRKVLTDIADRFQNWVKDESQKWAPRAARPRRFRPQPVLAPALDRRAPSASNTTGRAKCATPARCA